MATITKIVKGRYYDGVDSTVTGYVAEKIQDIIDVAVSVVALDVERVGDELACVITYTDA